MLFPGLRGEAQRIEREVLKLSSSLALLLYQLNFSGLSCTTKHLDVYQGAPELGATG